MTMRHRLLLSGFLGAVVLLVAVVLLAAACGGGGGSEPTTAEYEAAVVRAVDRTDFAFNRVSRAQTVDEAINRMGEASIAIEAAAKDLDELGAPAAFEQDNAKLVKALEDLGNDIGLTGEQLEDPAFRDAFIQDNRGFSFESWDEANLALGGLLGAGLQVKTLQRQVVQQ
jgi:hypothetical protein